MDAQYEANKISRSASPGTQWPFIHKYKQYSKYTQTKYQSSLYCTLVEGEENNVGELKYIL